VFRNQGAREQLIQRLADWFGFDCESARCWLDIQDAHAMATAQRILEAEPYTDIPVGHWYH
jgi:hypothetical protein